MCSKSWPISFFHDFKLEKLQSLKNVILEYELCELFKRKTTNQYTELANFDLETRLKEKEAYLKKKSGEQNGRSKI
jgi:hypothetical protein